MQMYTSFWCGVKIDNFLFKGFNIKSWQGMLGSCLGTASLACLFVIISFTREMFFNTDSSKRRGRALVANSTLIEVWTSTWKMHSVQTLLFLVQTTVGYFLMLIVMSYNVYLNLAVMVGTLIGYFILNPVLVDSKFIHRPVYKNVVKCNEEEERGALICNESQLASNISGDGREANQEFSVAAVIHNRADE